MAVPVSLNAMGRLTRAIATFSVLQRYGRALRVFARSSRRVSGAATGRSTSSIPSDEEDHLKRLADAGIDVDEEIESGQLEVHPWQDGPLRGERFDQDTWLAGFEDVLRSGPTAGYARTRFLAQMEWALVDMPGFDDLIEFETRVNYIVPKYDDPVICSYDLSKFGTSTVIYALRTHPVVIIGELVQENPFYVEPDQLLLLSCASISSPHVGAGRAQIDARRVGRRHPPPASGAGDLVALSAIPAAWVGREPPAVAAGLADALVALLQLDFAFVRLNYPVGDRAVDATRGNGWKRFPEWLERFTDTTVPSPGRAIVADAGDGAEPCRGVAISIGVHGDGGLVAAAGLRAIFRLRSTTCCCPWLRIKPRRLFRMHVSFTSEKGLRKSFERHGTSSR